MKCHQVLTGACNVGDKTFGVGSVEGVSLIAYAAGCNITILANSFERVQIIRGIRVADTSSKVKTIFVSYFLLLVALRLLVETQLFPIK